MFTLGDPRPCCDDAKLEICCLKDTRLSSPRMLTWRHLEVAVRRGKTTDTTKFSALQEILRTTLLNPNNKFFKNSGLDGAGQQQR